MEEKLEPCWSLRGRRRNKVMLPVKGGSATLSIGKAWGGIRCRVIRRATLYGIECIRHLRRSKATVTATQQQVSMMYQVHKPGYEGFRSEWGEPAALRCDAGADGDGNARFRESRLMNTTIRGCEIERSQLPTVRAAAGALQGL
jgi:hypothetical protein